MKPIIGAWVEPIPTLEDHVFAREAGFTHIFIGDDCFPVRRGTEQFAALLRLCGEAGLKAIVRTMNEYPFKDDTDYSAFPAVDGINYWDEPFDTDFSKLEDLLARHTKRYGGSLFFFINLNPNFVEPGWHPWSDDKTYEEYVEEFCRRILSHAEGRKFLSTDVYPIVRRGGERIIRASWLPNVRTIADAARKWDAEPTFFIQAGSHTNKENFFLYPTEEELRFQVFSEMAFGVRNFIYFTYADYGSETSGEWFTKGVVRNDVSCTPNAIYPAAKRLNADIMRLLQVTEGCAWGGTALVRGTDKRGRIETPLVSDPLPFQVTAERDALIGVFQGKDKTVLFCTGFTDPKEGLDTPIHIGFGKNVAYSACGAETFAGCSDTLEIKIPVGECLLISM